MNVISKTNDTITVELTIDELRLMLSVINEITEGPEALDQADWDMLIGWPRPAATALADQILDVLPPRGEPK